MSRIQSWNSYIEFTMKMTCSGHTLLTGILPKFTLKFINSILWTTDNDYISRSSTYIESWVGFYRVPIHIVFNEFWPGDVHSVWIWAQLTSLEPFCDVIVTSQWRRDVTLSNQHICDASYIHQFSPMVTFTFASQNVLI